nr:hypothetical protein CFP56_23884 [Quercus suber]
MVVGDLAGRAIVLADDGDVMACTRPVQSSPVQHSTAQHRTPAVMAGMAGMAAMNLSGVDSERGILSHPSHFVPKKAWLEKRVGPHSALTAAVDASPLPLVLCHLMYNLTHHRSFSLPTLCGPSSPRVSPLPPPPPPSLLPCQVQRFGALASLRPVVLAAHLVPQRFPSASSLLRQTISWAIPNDRQLLVVLADNSMSSLSQCG